MTDITQEVIDCWRINYGLDKRSPAEAAKWWEMNCQGFAPSGAVAALGTALDEIDRLRADIHSCHPVCTRAGCVNDRLLRVAQKRAAEEKAQKEKEKARVKAEKELAERKKLEEQLKSQVECPKCHHKFQLKNK